MTTDGKWGTILTPAQWVVAAGDYLSGHDDDWGVYTAEYAAESLGEYVNDQVIRLGLGDHYSYRGSDWVAVPDGEPYRNLWDMFTSWASAGDVSVSNLHCTHPVWNADTNIRFRVWHDDGHCREQLGFDPDGELRLFVKQYRALLAKGMGLAAAGLYSESVGQLPACLALDGFPDEQLVVQPHQATLQHLLTVLS